MKKVALSLAGVLAVAAFAPEASALPVFARQTGMACNACHFQHYPLLNSFGRSFKASGFTLMGAQGKVEGDNLSLPAVVNAAFLTSMGYEKTNAIQAPGIFTHNSANGTATTGSWFVAGLNGEASLFLGGRGSDFMGFLTEITLGNGAAAADSVKTPILVDVGAGGIRAGVVPFTTNGQGASYGFETMNTGANAIHSITNTVGFQGEYINAVSAQQYVGTGAHATGLALVAASDMGFINVTKFAGIGPDSGGGYGALGSTYARLAITGDLAGWDSGIGFQNWSGTSINAAPGAILVPTVNAVTGLPTGNVVPGVGLVGGLAYTKATAFDGQAQGAIGGLPVGFYFSYAKAPKSDIGAQYANAYNPSTQFDRTSFNIDAEVGVVPEKVTVGAAVRRGKAGVADAAGANATDNAVYLTATYKLAQNLLTRLSYVQQSGTLWSGASPVVGSVNTYAQDVGSKTWTVNLYALF